MKRPWGLGLETSYQYIISDERLTISGKNGCGRILWIVTSPSLRIPKKYWIVTIKFGVFIVAIK